MCGNNVHTNVLVVWEYDLYVVKKQFTFNTFYIFTFRLCAKILRDVASFIAIDKQL